MDLRKIKWIKTKRSVSTKFCIFCIDTYTCDYYILDVDLTKNPIKGLKVLSSIVLPGKVDVKQNSSALPNDTKCNSRTKFPLKLCSGYVESWTSSTGEKLTRNPGTITSLNIKSNFTQPIVVPGEVDVIDQLKFHSNKNFNAQQTAALPNDEKCSNRTKFPLKLSHLKGQPWASLTAEKLTQGLNESTRSLNGNVTDWVDMIQSSSDFVIDMPDGEKSRLN